MQKPDPLSWTLRFKKHKLTVLLMLPSTTSIASTKEQLYKALRSRDLAEINGDTVPENPREIEFGVLVDTNDSEKVWSNLDQTIATKDEGNKRGALSRREASSIDDMSLQAAGIKNNQAIAFRFCKVGNIESNAKNELDLEDEEDASWDVIVPTLDDEEPE